MKPGECDLYYPGGTVPGQMGWIKFLAIFFQLRIGRKQ
jgi:hypothetical protein